jgi:diguanylate cyclase
VHAEAGRWPQPGEVVELAGVAGTGWVVWRATRTEALLATVHSASVGAGWRAAALALLVTLLACAFMARQLRPLSLLERRAERLLAGEGRDEEWPHASGEIGRLERALRKVATERALSEQARADVLQRLSSVMQASPVGLAFTRNQRFELVSAECCRMLGRREAELLNQPAQLIFASNEDYRALGPQVGAAFAAHGAYVGEWQLLHADGHVYWARLHARPVAASDPAAGTIWCLYDISREVASRATLEHAAEHDPLTGVLNRKGFERVLGAAFAEPEVPTTLVMLDLDRFKPINDSAGHAAGDAMLKAVARTLQDQVRATDHVARLGGDEFALLLPGCPPERAGEIAEQVRAAIAALTLGWQGRTLRVSVSLGLAARAAQQATPADWLAEADAACYAAKAAGRDRVQMAPAASRTPLRAV